MQSPVKSDVKTRAESARPDVRPDLLILYRDGNAAIDARQLLSSARKVATETIQLLIITRLRIAKDTKNVLNKISVTYSTFVLLFKVTLFNSLEFY